MSDDQGAHNPVQPLGNASNVYTVATLGFGRRERRTLHRVLAISEAGSPTFRPFEAGARRYPHIVIVNGDSPAAIQKWRHFERSARRKNVSAIFTSREPATHNERYVLARPVLPILMLTLLEHVAAEHHGFLKPAARSPQETRILAIAASLSLRIRINEALEPIGARVDFAVTRERIYARIDAQRYSLVLLDTDPWGESAYDLCDRIYNHRRQRRPPIVILSSNASSAGALKARLSGCETLLQKPVDDATLLRAVTGALDAARDNTVRSLPTPQ
jgi:CheY-like chemotaxis protein